MARRPQALKPHPCAKCGSVKGWKGPVYKPAIHEFEFHVPEKLLFTCRTCGYQRKEPTKDAPPPGTYYEAKVIKSVSGSPRRRWFPW